MKDKCNFERIFDLVDISDRSLPDSNEGVNYQHSPEDLEA